MSRTFRFFQNVFLDSVFYIKHSKSWYLTFDDGPSDYTEDILKLLDKHNVKATFFCTGQEAEKRRKTFDKIVSQGHEIGIHGYKHVNPWFMSNQSLKDDILHSRNLLNSSLYRPPYGKTTPFLRRFCKNNDISVILYDVMMEDWKKISNIESHTKAKMKEARNGSIFVLHDNAKAHKNALQMLEIMLSENHKKFQNNGIRESLSK